MRLLPAAAAAAAMAMPSPALAAEWVFYSESDSGALLYYDADSLRTDGRTATVWVREDASRDRTVDYREARRHLMIDCTNNTRRLLAFTVYGADGGILSAETIPPAEQEDMEIPPDTIGDDLRQAVCR